MTISRMTESGAQEPSAFLSIGSTVLEAAEEPAFAFLCAEDGIFEAAIGRVAPR